MNDKKTLLINITKDLHTRYKKLCKEEGWNMSQRIRNFIQAEINNSKIQN